MGLDMFLEKTKKNETKRNTEKEVLYWRKEYNINIWFTRNLEEVNKGQYLDGGCFEGHVTRDDMVKFYNFLLNMNEENGYKEYNKYVRIETMRKVKNILDEDDFERYDYVYINSY